MSGVFRNINPHPLSPPGEYVRLWCGGEDTLAGWRGGWEVNILEDARHSSVLYICTVSTLCNHSISPAYDFYILQAAVQQKQSLVKDGVAAPLLTAANVLHDAAAPPAVAAAAPATVAAAVSDAVSASVPACRSCIYPTGVSCGTYFL